MCECVLVVMHFWYVCMQQPVIPLAPFLLAHLTLLLSTFNQAPFMLKYKMSNLDEYSSDDAWPTLFDDFVDWTRSPGVYDEAEEGSECEEVEVSAVPTATKGFASILESDSVLERDEDEEDEEEGDGQDATKVESKGA
mmetsp:Transcript_22983/g.58291  ORF Transcript_22983/g.58291 Transcript_22983/m.58291 type:complete len:138 (-) Transcript_22983:454-867(-)